MSERISVPRLVGHAASIVVRVTAIKACLHHGRKAIRSEDPEVQIHHLRQIAAIASRAVELAEEAVAKPALNHSEIKGPEHA